VGALTSGTYRYKTRPWEMKHVGTICTHCADGCKTTLGVRNNEIIRGNNRDRSGINGEFLCIKGRYAADFVNSPERLQSPLVRRNGKLEPVSWSHALTAAAAKLGEVKARGGKFAVIGSNHTSNEENYYLQKFAREALGTNNIDHHRTGDVATLLDALSGKKDALATTADLYDRKRSWWFPAISRSSIRFSRFRSAPTIGITTRTSTPLRPARCANKASRYAASLQCPVTNWPT
jgi:NADH-quinone oxidoreductase subunit G